jgi:hypothetical protein
LVSRFINMPFIKGTSGNPSGRPANGVTAAIRALEGAPEAVASYVLSVLEDESAPRASRQWAAEYIADRLDGKPVSASFNVTAKVEPQNQLPANWDQMPIADQRAFINRLKSGG